MNHSDPVVQTVRLAKRFGRCEVFRDVNLALSTGECVAVLGPNGSGKTTLLRCLAGLVRPTSGSVSWLGKSSPGQLPSRFSVSFVGHRSALYENLTIRENLLFAARMHGVAAPHRRCTELLAALQLSSQHSSYPAELSRGQLQRADIARSLVVRPHLWLLDEPWNGLDEAGLTAVAQILDRLLRQGTSVCFSTHLMPSLAGRSPRPFHLRQTNQDLLTARAA